MTTAPAFQHRHYRKIAAEIAAQRNLDVAGNGTISFDRLAAVLATMFAADNGRFDRERFLAVAMGAPINGRDKAR